MSTPTTLHPPVARIRPRRRRHDECGSISVFLATAAFAFIIVVGIAVDMSGKVHSQQQARSVAAEAARAGAQEMQVADVAQGDKPHLDTSAAVAAAHQYLNASGVSGTVTLRDGTTLIVQTRQTYHAKFLGIIGLDTAKVTGEGSARLIRTEGGTEQ